MLHRFYTDTVITKMIKHLVSSTHLPTMTTWKSGDLVIAGLTYVTKDAVVYAKRTGYPKVVNDFWFKILYPYSFGSYYKGVTTRFSSNIKGYDGRTHYTLGQYLRAVRDLGGVDLMPYYNCVTNEYLRGVSFDSEGVLHAGDSVTFNTLCIPVKYDKTYTVGISSAVPIQYGFIFYGETGYLPIPTGPLNELIAADLGISLPAGQGKNQQVVLRNLPYGSVENPVAITSPRLEALSKNPGLMDTIGSSAFPPIPSQGPADEINYRIKAFAQYEKDLRLILRIPKSLTTSVVVLEGDFTNTASKTLVQSFGALPAYTTHIEGKSSSVQIDPDSGEVISNPQGDTPAVQKEVEYIGEYSPLSLLQLNDGVIYAFSDRLVEYLLGNVITQMDTTLGDITRVQRYANSAEAKRPSSVTKSYILDTPVGVWSPSLRKYLFKWAMQSKQIERKLDLSGYVDRDVERIITRGFTPEWQDLTTL